MRKTKKDYSKLPEYRIVVNADDLETGVQMISIVDEPAIEVKGMFFAPQDFDVIIPPCHQTWDGTDNCQCDIIDGIWYTGDDPCEFCLENKANWEGLNFNFSNQKFSADNDQQILVGPALIPDKRIYRNGKDDGSGPHLIYFTAEDIKVIAQKFNKGNNNKSINVSHSSTGVNGYIMENWLVADPIYDKSKMYGYNLPAGTWFVTMKIDDGDFWQKEVKELGKYSFSIEGNLGQVLTKFAVNTPVDDESLLQKLDQKQLLVLADYALKLMRK